MRKHTFSIIAVILILSASLSYSQEMPYKTSIQTNPLGIFTNSYGLTVEHNFYKNHGLLAEGFLANNTQIDGYMFSLHYRYYRAPEPNSKFLFFLKSDTGVGFYGIFFKTTEYSSEVEITEDDVKKKFNFDCKANYAGVNIGRNYYWDSGFSLSYRFGYGYPMADITWKGQKPEEYKAFELFYVFFSGFDFGMTVGYSF